jgi:hypothetical protein
MHEWDRGVLNASSWHGLEEIGTFTDAESMLMHGYASGAWPLSIEKEALRTVSGVNLDSHVSITASYQAHPTRSVGVVQGRYHHTEPSKWAELCRAATLAGAKPTGAFSLREGSIILATFEVNGRNDGIATNLMICDSFNGSQKLSCGTTSVRVVCANTMTAAFQQDGAGMAKLRHTASLNEQINILRGNIGVALQTGEKLRELYRTASNVQLTRESAKAAFDALFPEAPADASKAAITRAENERTEARQAAVLAVNKVGSLPANLGTLWNAATYLVDRKPDGSKRETKGDSDMLDSLLFGTRAKRVTEIHDLISSIVSVPEVQIGALLRSLSSAGGSSVSA